MAVKKEGKITVKTIKFAQQNVPIFNTIRGKDYVSYGEDNLFCNYLLELSTQSALHQAILDKKVKMLMGEKIVYNENNNKQKAFIEKCNNNNENLRQVMDKCAQDLEIMGGFDLQIIWAKDKRTILEIYHLPYERMRCAPVNENGLIDTYFYSTKWTKWTQSKDIEVMPAYDITKDQNLPQVLSSFQYKSGVYYYGLPSYIGALNDIDTLKQISIFHNSNIKNNFAPGALIIFRGPEPSEQAMDAIVKQLETKYKGSSASGEPVIFFLDTDQQEPTIQQIAASDLDKMFEQLSSTSKENVTLAHSIPRSAAGLEEKGALGDSKNIIENELYFYNSYVKYQQEFLLATFNRIMSQNGWEDITIKNASSSLILYSEALLSSVLTKDELRLLFGYEPFDKNANANDVVLIEKIGIGGTTALKEIVGDPAMTDEQKRGLLTILFGLTSDQVNTIIPNVTTPTTQNPIA